VIGAKMSTKKTEEGISLLKDFIKLHNNHGCLENPNFHQVLETFVDFYHSKTKKNKGGKMMLYELLSMKSNFLKSRKSQFYTSFTKVHYKTLTKECKSAFELWRKEFNGSLEGLPEKLELLSSKESDEREVENELAEKFKFAFEEKYEYLYVDGPEDLSNLKNSKYLLLEIPYKLETSDVDKISNSESSNLILYLTEQTEEKVLSELENCHGVKYYICDSFHSSQKKIQVDDWYKDWIEACMKLSMINFFYTDNENKIFRKALMKNDNESIYHVALVLYEYQMYSESLRFLIRGKNNKKININLLYLLDSFYTEGIADIKRCPVQSNSIKEIINLIKNK
jgi:hypothetical protein